MQVGKLLPILLFVKTFIQLEFTGESRHGRFLYRWLAKSLDFILKALGRPAHVLTEKGT